MGGVMYWKSRTAFVKGIEFINNEMKVYYFVRVHRRFQRAVAFRKRTRRARVASAQNKQPIG